MCHEKHGSEPCPSCGKKFFFFSRKGEQGDNTLSIPATDDAVAEDLMTALVKNPKEWKREKGLEESMKGYRTTGKTKTGKNEGPGAMFG